MGMNKHFRKWIDEVIPLMENEFTVGNVVSKIIELKGTSRYIGNTQSVGMVLSKKKDLEGLGDGRYRKVSK